MVVVCSCFFFFKQKTAYEMRISDWSSDVCSSDLCTARVRDRPVEQCGADPLAVPAAEHIALVEFDRGLGPVPRKGDRPQFDEADDPVVLGRGADREIGSGDLRGQAFVAERRADEGGERSAERRGGEAGVRTCGCRWSPRL